MGYGPLKDCDKLRCTLNYFISLWYLLNLAKVQKLKVFGRSEAVKGIRVDFKGKIWKNRIIIYYGNIN